MSLKKILLLLALAAFVFDAVFTEKPFWANKYIWDEPDPRLVGQVVKFNKPMGYILIREDSDGKPTKEELAIGKRLIRNSSFEDLYKIYGYTNEEFEEIAADMEFTIRKVGWFRKDVVSREFTGDRKVAILRDEDGAESIASFHRFFDSNRPEFFDLRGGGRYGN